jgi:hypothetical protein
LETPGVPESIQGSKINKDLKLPARYQESELIGAQIECFERGGDYQQALIWRRELVCIRERIEKETR